MDISKAYLVVLVVAFLTFCFRYLPFAFYKYLQNNLSLEFIRTYLPASIMLLLTLYTLKDISFKNSPFGLPEIIASIIVVVVHLKWRNALLSILLGTGLCVALKYSF